MTGANRGIGLACARSLRSQGFAVAAASRSGAVSDADDFSNVTCDVRSTSQVEAAAREVEVAFGSLDVVVANAGISALAKTQRITDQALAQVIDVNFAGAFRLVRAALPGMIERRFGRVILISSLSALFGSAGNAHYAASKAAQIGLARSLAREVANRNITVNVVAPGFIDTEMTSTDLARFRDAITDRIPVGRYGLAHEVGQLVAALAHEHAGYITGSVIQIDGGMGMGY